MRKKNIGTTFERLKKSSVGKALKNYNWQEIGNNFGGGIETGGDNNYQWGIDFGGSNPPKKHHKKRIKIRHPIRRKRYYSKRQRKYLRGGYYDIYY